MKLQTLSKHFSKHFTTSSKNVPNTCPTFRTTTLPKKFSNFQNVSNINPTIFKFLIKILSIFQQIQTSKHDSRNFQTKHKQTPKNVFGNFSKLSNNTTHCQHKNTVPEVQNTHPNIFLTFKTYFIFPKARFKRSETFPKHFPTTSQHLQKRS